MKYVLLITCMVMLSACDNPAWHVADGKILWDNSGCAYMVNTTYPYNDSNGPKVTRLSDADKETCQPVPQAVK